MFDWNQAAAEAFGKTPAQGGDPQPSMRSDDDPVLQFVAENAGRAARAAQALGTSPEHVLGQWGLETGWGRHVVPGSNNLGNIKDFSGGGVAARDNMLGTTDNYRQFDSADSFADAYTDLLKRRYNVQGAASPEDFARALKAGGYAQDPDYVNKLVRAIGMVRGAGVPLGQPAAPRDVSWQNPDLAGAQAFDLTPEKPKDAGGFVDHMKQGAARGFEQSKGLAGGMAALLGKTADSAFGESDLSKSVQDWGMGLYKRKMEESGKLSNDASLTDVLDGKADFTNWMGDALGYLGYQAAESVMTGGAGALLAKTIGKGAVQATAKGMIAKEVAKLTAANAEQAAAKKLTAEQIARVAVDNVATKIGAAVPVFANNLRQEGGSIYGEAVEGGHGDDLGRIWLASLGAAGVDTAAEAMFAEKLLGQGRGYSGSYLKRFGKEAGAGALTQGGTEGIQTAVERWGAQQDLTGADAMRDYIDSIGVGAFGGAAGAPMAAMHEAKAKVDQAAAQPDSPLARAARAGGGAQVAAMQAGAIGQEQAQPSEASGAMVPAGSPVIDNRITRLDAELTPVIQAMRANPAYGPTSVNEVLSAFAVAKNPNTEPAMRARILGALEQHIAQFKSNPNWTSGNAGAQPDGAAGTAVAPAANTAVGSPVAAQDGRVLDGSAREVRDATAMPGQPVGALPAPSVPALQDNRAKAAADADYEAGYADLVKLEQLDRERDALARLAKHDQTAADRLHEIQLTIDGNRAIETANKRRAALSTLLDHPNAAVLTYQGLANAAQLVLRHAGFRDTRLTPDEQAALQRFSDLNDTFRAGPDVAPAAPNELSMPERAKAVQRAPSASGGRMLGIRKALAQGARISGNKVLSKHGKALFSNLTDAEIRDVTSAKANDRPMTEAAPAVDPGAAAPALSVTDQTEKPHAVSEKPHAAVGEAVQVSPDTEQGGTPSPAAADTIAEGQGDTVGETAQETRTSTPAPARPLDFADFARKHMGTVPKVGTPELDKLRADYKAYRDGLATASATPLDQAAHEAATSPANDKAEPTDKQKESGKYEKGPITVAGIRIDIENPAGSTRSGTDEDGKRWSQTMRDHYGEILGTRGADGDKIDAFVVPGTPEDYAGPIYVIDQKNAKGGFDEHKVVIGASDPQEAVAIYRRNYEPGWDGVLSVAGFKSPEQFKQWLASRDHGRPANEWIKAQEKSDAGTTDTAAPEQVAVGADDNKRSREPNDAEAQNGGEAEARDSVDAETQQGDDLSPEVREKFARAAELVGTTPAEVERRYRAVLEAKGRATADASLDGTISKRAKQNGQDKATAEVKKVAHKESVEKHDLSTVEGIAAAIRDEIADSRHRQQIKSLDEHLSKGWLSQDRYDEDRRGFDSSRDAEKSVDPVGGTLEVARAIHGKDVETLISKFLHGIFDSSEKVFGRATGVRIHRLSAENKRQALYQWGGWDAGRIKAFEDGERARAEESASRFAEDEKRKALERSWDALSRVDARDNDGTVVKMGDWLLRKFGDGFNRITTNKRGVATVYHLSSGDGTINHGIKHKAWTEFLKAAEKSGGLESALRQLGKLAKQDDEPSAPASDRAGEAGPEKAYYVSGNTNGGRVAVELGEGFDAHPVSLPSAPGFKFIAHRSVGDNFMPTDKFSVSEEITGLSVTTGADSVEEAIRLADARIERAGLEKLSGSIDKAGPVSALPKYERTADDTSESSDDGLSGVRDLIAKTEAETKSAFNTLAPLGFELHEPVVKHPDTVAQWKRERKSDVDVVSLRRKDGDFVYVLTATDGGDPQYFATPAEVSTALEGVEVEHHAAPESSDNDLDAMFDDVLSEVVGEKAPKKPRAPRKQALGPRVTNADGSYYNLPAEAPKKPRSAGKAAASAAGNAAKGIGDTIAALGALFGGNGKLSSGLTFDEQTYERAKPLFKQAVAHFSAAGSDLREAMQAVVRMVVEQFGAQTAANMKPYVVRFIGDMRDGKLEDGNVDQRNGSAGSETLGDVAAGENRSPQEAGDVGGGDAQRGGRGAEADSGSDRLGPSAGGGAGGGDQGAHSARSGKGRGGRGLGGRGTGSTRAGVSGDDGGGREGGAGLRPQESVASPAVPAINFEITKDVRLGSGGEVEKFNDNLAAIRTLRAIESENRRATPDEQRTLARYVGWGGLANAFADDEGNFKPGWEARGSELASLLLPSELKAARRSTRNAHYTSETVVRAMWDAVERLGFSGGNAIEPSVGTGNFIGLMPEIRRADTRFIGVEYDSLTARIAKALYPQSTILHSGFQNVPLADNSFDLAIGNPPFGRESLRFAHKPELRGDSIHNQFFRASMDAVKPGGLHVMVVSRYLMDRMDKSARVALATEAELLGAIRLPDTAFAENARTQVVTDILFLRKRDAVSRGEASDAFRFSTTQMSAKEKREETPEMRAARERIVAKYTPQFRWLDVTKVPDPLGSEPMEINTYFADNPHMIAGRLERSGSMKFSRDEETGEKIKDINVVLGDGKSLGAELSRIINTYLPKIAPEPKSAEVIARSVERFRTMSDALAIAVSGREVGDVHFDDAGNLIEIVERETPEGEFELSSRTLSADSPWSGSLYMDADGRWFRVVPLVDEAGNKVKKPGKDGKPTRLNEMVRETFATDADVPEGMRLGASAFARLHHLAKLRDVLKRQLVLETQDAGDAEIEANRTELARLYNDFVAKHEQITSPKNASLVSEMPDGALLIALESDYRPAITPARAKRTGERVRSASASQAAILSKRVLRPYAPADRANSPSDALLISLSESGKVDLERIAALLGTDEPGAIKALHDDMESPLIFKNPETEQWETAQHYLSGNVRKALEAAKAAGLEKNVAALEKVQPEPWGAEAVTPKIGANWVPADVYAEFAEKITGGKARVSFAPITNSFAIHSSGRSNEYGTDRISAQSLLDHLLNSKSISIFDEYEDKRVFNKEETALANLKARAISLEFDDWVFADGERRDRLVKVFNDKFNNRVPRQHDGSHLKLIGKVPDEVLKLRPHQMNAIWRGVVEKFVLYDHVVGAGKTFTAVARAMERRRMGLSRKPMIVVPNHLVESWAAEVYRLYPGAKMLAAGAKDFSRSRRRQLFARIATGDWDLVIVPHSSFEFIDIAPETEERYLEGELALAKQAIKDAEEEAAEQGLDGGWRKPFNVKEAERLAEKIETRLAGLKKRTRDKLLTFEQLGVDDMTIDEAHEFKNLYYSTRLTKVRGMGDKQGSQKALDIYNKVRVLREGDGSVCFMTGTPISNSAVEMYTLMRFLAADELRDLGLEHFDGWRSQFVDVSTKFEPNEAGRLQAVDRLGRSWANMRSLMELYYSFTDAVTLDDIRRDYRERNNGEEFPVPRVKGGDRQSIVVKPTPAQIEALEQILTGFDSLDAIEDPNQRNAERLRLMDRARKVSLDVRAVNPFSDSDERGGKLDVVADEVAKLYQQWNEDKGTQLVFLDRSVPKAKGDDAKLKEFDKLRTDQEQALRNGDEEAYRRLNDKLDGFDRNEMEELRIAQASPWTAYKQIKENLIARGIPADQIRFVQEANDDAKKKALFDAVNDGEVRVLIGSTPRMGAGTNVQKRLVGLHHVDVTWKPSDIEQREGRIIRQGNLFATPPKPGYPNPLYRPDFEVTINAYATERTVDAKMWDLNATKLRMINGIRNYDGSFTMDFPDEQSVGMAELAALASGDPMLLERVQLMAEIEQLELLERAHRRKMFGAQDRLDWARRSIERLPARIAETRERAAFLADQFAKAEQDHASRSVTIEGKTFTQAERMEANKHALDLIESAKAGKETARFALNVDGQRYTSKDAVADAISAALGDSSPFSMALTNGDVLHRRFDAARELAAKINAAMNGSPAGNFDAGRLLGLRLEVDYRRGKVHKTATLSLTTDDGRTVASEEKETAESKEFSSTLIYNALSDLLRAAENQASDLAAQWDESELERAKRSLPEYEEAVKEPFRQADDLKAKRVRLEEVTKSLSGTGATASAATTDDAMASLGVQSTGHTPADIREALVARFGAKAIDGLERAGLLNIARYADVPVSERRPDASASYSPNHGRAWLYADRLTPATAAAKLMHELGEHHGLEAMLGQRGWSAIKQQLRVMARVAGSDAQAAWSGVKALYAEFDGMTDSELASSDRFVHEVLARLGERDGGRKAPLWRGMVAKIKAWLASRWGISTFSERDMPALIEGSLMRLARGGDGGPRGGVRDSFASIYRPDAGALSDRIRRVVSEFRSGGVKVGDSIVLGRTPSVLRFLGAPDLPLHITGGVIDKVANDKHRHVMDADRLSDAIAHLANPLMVFQSDTRPGDTLVALTEVLDRLGNPVIVPVSLQKQAGRVLVNDVTSVYGKERAQTELERWASRGRLMYVRNEESLATATTQPLQLHRVVQTARGSGSSIATEADVVKRFGGPLAAIRHGGEPPRRDDFVTPDLPGWESNASGDLAYWEGKPVRMKWGFHQVDGGRRSGAGLLHLVANGRENMARRAPDVAGGDEAENVARMLVKLLPQATQKFQQFNRNGEKFGLSSPRMPGGVIVQDMGEYWGVVSLATPAMKANWGDGESTSRPVAWVSGLGQGPAWGASSPVPATAPAFSDQRSADAPLLQSKGQPVTVSQIDAALNGGEGARKPVTVTVARRRRTIDPDSPMGAVMDRADAADPDMPMASVEFSMDAFREGVQPTSWLNGIVKRFGESSELFGGLDKSIHSQLHKAAKNPYFGRVFDLLNRQMNDANRASLRPADRARTVLPKIDVLENWKEPLMAMLKGREHQADVDVAFKAVLEGTRRDTVFDNAQQAGLTEEQFSVYQEFREAIDASLDEMAAAEAFKLASSVLGQSIQKRIVDDPENADSTIKEGLTEARDAAQMRADSREEAARYLVPNLNLNELATLDLDEYSMEQAQALRLLRDAIDEVKQIEGFIASVDEVFDLAAKLKNDGYAPLMRFGRFYLDVYRTDPTTGEIIKDDDVLDPITGELIHEGTGEPIREFYSHFETQAERDAAEKELRAEFADDPHVVFDSGTVSEKAWEQLRGVSPESVMLFAKAAGIDADSVMQDFYRKALSARSTLKRKIHRKNGADGLRGVRGYSTDGARVLAAFLTSNGRRAGQLYHDKEIKDATEAFPKAQGSEKDEAISLVQHVQSPGQPGALSSGVLFAWYLGGSLSNFLINATQPAMVTLPWLSQHVGAMRAGSLLKRAYGLVRHPERMPRDLSSALSEAEEEGVVGANEAFHLYQEAGRPLANKFADSVVGRGVLKVFGQKGLEDAQYRLEGFLKMWGAPFAVAEHLNRRSTFIAAYLAAQEKGLDPYATAVRAVNETQFMYGKINAPNWARSSIGKLVFTFKLFSISYIEMLTRMARQGSDGRKAALLGLGMLFLATGLSGMPGADDLDDLIDTLLQSLGYNWSTKLEKKRLVDSIVGKQFSGLVLNGLSSIGPFDLTNRMGLGNLIPATGLFKPSETNKMAQLFELIGPTGGLVKSWVEAADAVRGGDMSGVVRAAAPKALKDLYAGIDMLETGEYRDGKGRKVTDVTAGDALSKMIGFQPADVADVQRKIGSVIPLTTLQRQASSSVAEKWAQMIENGEPGAAVRARQMVDDWNRKNPDTPIAVPKLANVMHRVKQSRLSKQARMVKNAPIGMRDTVEEIVGEDEE